MSINISKKELRKKLTLESEIGMEQIEEDSNSASSDEEKSEREGMSVNDMIQESKERSLALLMQRRDSIKHMQTLRKVSLGCLLWSFNCKSILN